MKKLILLALMGLSVPAAADSLSINKWGGLNTDDSPATLPLDNSPDSQNVLTDVGPGVVSRQGYVSLSTTPCAGGLWSFSHSNGTRYLLCHDTTANVLKASNNGGQNFTIAVSTIASGAKIAVTNLGDTVYFANTTDGLKSWDTSTVSVTSAALTVDKLVTYKGCLWAAGKASDPRTIFKSSFVSGSAPSFTLVTDPAVTDPSQFVIGGSLDEPLSGLYASFQDRLIWFKAHSFGYVGGKDRGDFESHVYSDQFGSSYPESVQDCKGLLRWLGARKTIWEWDGATLTDISDQPKSKIKTLLGTIAQGDANSRTYQWTSQADFSLGTNNQTSNSVSPNDLVLATWTATDTSASDFSSGVTFTSVDTTTLPGSIILSTNNTNVSNNDFESVTGSNAANWVQSNAIAGNFGIAKSGTNVMGMALGASDCTGPDNFSIDVLDNSGNLLSNTPYTFTDQCSGNFTQYSLNLQNYIGRLITIKVRFDLGVTHNYFQNASSFLCSGSTMTFWLGQTTAGNGANHVFDLFQGGQSTITSGTFLSRSFDTAFSTPAWLSSGATVPQGSATFQTQVSADNSSWDSLVPLTVGSAPASNWKRYIRYQLSLTTTTSETARPEVDDVTFSARSSTGSWVSNSVAMSSQSGWASFVATTDLFGGSVVYTVYTDTDSSKTVTNGVPVAGTYTSSQIMTSGSIPTLSTAAYVFVGESFTITSATQVPTTHDLTVQWTEGSTLKVPSAFTNNRYWLGIAVNSTSNNTMLVFDRNRQWQKWSGISPTVMTMYNVNPVFSNTSGTWQAESGTTDNGSAIASYYTTPTFSPASPDIISMFDHFQVTTDQSAETLGTNFYINGGSTAYPLGSYAMNTTTGIQNKKLPFPFFQVQQGSNIALKFSVTGSTFWRLLGGTLSYIPDKVPK